VRVFFTRAGNCRDIEQGTDWVTKKLASATCRVLTGTQPDGIGSVGLVLRIG
jgi:hypothetical protein